MAATSDNNLTYITSTDRVVYPVDASALIYSGVFVGENGATAAARPLVAGDNFLGISTEYVDNSAGVTGAKDVEVKFGEHRLIYNVDGVSDPINAIGDSVYASDDDTLTTSSASSTNTKVGKIIRWISGSLCEIRIDTKIQYY